MEEKHKQRLLAAFPAEMRYKDLHVLGIPDEYRFMDEELVAELESSVHAILESYDA